ncbi:ThiF family adenylyltransferase [Olleya namhaensis]|uniref:ThiF family adenylyltransferase n=1 Tax=Olleya namhaensis TaxID=1144750 RepID=UPI002492909E|nr:ThiF family adenylyltransferase [Olleya namhaensis]
MIDRITKIKEIFNQFQIKNNLKITKGFEIVDTTINGEIEIICDTKPNIVFDVSLLEIYPLKFVGIESIRFVSKELIEYDHLNKDGSICYTSLTHPDLEYKLEHDILAMLEWVDKYYVKEIDDGHFEYLVYDNVESDKVFLFCDNEDELKDNDFGQAIFSKQAETEGKKTFLLQGFKSQIDNSKNAFKWSNAYNSPNDINKGLYYISSNVPASFRNFAFKNWQDFNDIFHHDFLKYLNDIRQHIDKKHLLEGRYLMLFYGFPISDNKFHFESIKIDTHKIPTSKDGLINQKIVWCKTVDSSYDLFFGRGKLHNEITDKKILIIGLGAIGSVLAESLVRGGCKLMAIVDGDIKEVGNICRSKFDFINGETSKAKELEFKLISISPFVEIIKSNVYLLPGHSLGIKNGKHETAEVLNQYDYIFNCTADNGVSIILDKLELTTNVISMSISNHAKELVCNVGNKEIFKNTSNIFNCFKQDEKDLFNPQGCWAPTFKASFHNITTLVNHALSNIDYKFKNGKPLKTFMLQVEENDNYTIKLKD